MKPEDLDTLHPCYDEYWMTRFLQETPGLGGWVYQMSGIIIRAIEKHLKTGVELSFAVPVTNDNPQPGFAEYTLIDEAEDGGMYWNYHKIVLALQTQLQSTLAKMEVPV